MGDGQFIIIVALLILIFISSLYNNFKLYKMGNELDQLTAAVAASNTVIDSAVVLLNGLKDKLDAAIASGDPAQLTALSASIGAKKDELAAAVVENTPAEDNPDAPTE